MERFKGRGLMKQSYTPDLVCFSHLRWNFVFQRPQHLMSRFAKTQRVFFIEEPLFQSGTQDTLRTTVCAQTGVHIVTPHLREDHADSADIIVNRLLHQFFKSHSIAHPVAWFYSPMWLDGFPEDLNPTAVVYDCMDELSLFRTLPRAFIRTNPNYSRSRIWSLRAALAFSNIRGTGIRASIRFRAV